MGKLSVILVFAAILTGGTLVFNMQRTSLDTDSRLAYQQAQFFAREAAFAGMEIEMRESIRLVAPGNPPTGFSSGFSVPFQPYEGAFYSVNAVRGSCPNVANWDSLGTLYNYPSVSAGLLMDVTSVGRYGTGADAIYHEVNGCYVVINAASSTPPWSEYAFISNEDFTFNGAVSVDTIAGLGNIHSNGTMDLGPQVRIAGNVTYVESGTTKPGTETGSFQPGEGVSMTPFDPYEVTYMPDASLGHRIESASPSISGDVTIAPSTWNGSPPAAGELGSKENPYYWYINGDLTLGGTTHLRLPVYTIIVITGDLTVGGSASVTVSEESAPASGSGSALTSWIESNLSPEGEGMLGFYVNGTYYEPNGSINDPAPGGVELNGTGNFVGNVFTNGSYTLSGGGQGSNLIGSVAAYGDVTGHGGGGGANRARNFWYAGMADEIVHPGTMIPSNIISLISISEWVDPVIRNTGGI
jgi:hypothetical protein